MRIYSYRLTYLEQSQLKPNFGVGDWTVPMIVHRGYNEDAFESEQEADEHVMKLSDPQASKIEKKVIESDGSDKGWEVIWGQ